MPRPMHSAPAQSAWSTQHRLLSLLAPGLGHLCAGRRKHGLAAAGSVAAMIAVGVAVGRAAGASAEIFLFVTFGLPLWLLQAYDAGLPLLDNGAPLRTALRVVLERAHDLRYLGLLFLLTALMDLYIILINPEYALTIFCMKPTGLSGTLAKAQSPTLHLLIGYRFLTLSRWALLLYLAYAGFGLLNATANFACFGYGRVRTVFLLSLLAFTAYVWMRREQFQNQTT